MFYLFLWLELYYVSLPPLSLQVCQYVSTYICLSLRLTDKIYLWLPVWLCVYYITNLSPIIYIHAFPLRIFHLQSCLSQSHTLPGSLPPSSCTCLSLCLSICWHISLLCISLPLPLSLSPSLYMPVYLTVSTNTYVCLCLSLSLALPLSPPLFLCIFLKLFKHRLVRHSHSDTYTSDSSRHL